MFDMGEVIDGLRDLDRELDNATRVDLLGGLEALKSACAAAQAKLAADLDRSRRAERAAQEIPADLQGRGIAAEVALARRDSPHQGGRHLGLAQALVNEMPYALAQLETGLISEWRATILVRETACLTREDRAAIDEELCADPQTIAGLGDRALAAKAREHAARRDVEALVRRARRAEGDRRVSTRPAPDTMAYVTALLPVQQAVAVQARLGRDADSIVATGDERTRSQIMADLLVARVSGIDLAQGPAITVNLVISDRALFGDGAEPAHVSGFGSVPIELAQKWVELAANNDVAELRRVYVKPETGALVAMESKARAFSSGLARFVDVRDRVCRTPWCDAPIRHRDHIRSRARGGVTSADNAAGLCEACNYAKEGAGWRAEPEQREPGELHSYELTTPAGKKYRSTAPPLPTPLPFGTEIYRLGTVVYAA